MNQTSWFFFFTACSHTSHILFSLRQPKRKGSVNSGKKKSQRLTGDKKYASGEINHPLNPFSFSVQTCRDNNTYYPAVFQFFNVMILLFTLLTGLYCQVSLVKTIFSIFPFIPLIFNELVSPVLLFFFFLFFLLSKISLQAIYNTSNGMSVLMRFRRPPSGTWQPSQCQRSERPHWEVLCDTPTVAKMATQWEKSRYRARGQHGPSEGRNPHARIDFLFY